MELYLVPTETMLVNEDVCLGGCVKECASL